MTQPQQQRFKSIIKPLMLGSLIILAIAIARQSNLRELLQTSLRWVENLGSLSPIAFILVYNLATVLFIPGSLLTMSGGVMFGLVWGSIYVTIAAILGATLAFTLGRCWCRDLVSKILQDRPQFHAINTAVGKEGFKIVLLTRLCPVLPFNLLNYAFGITEVSLRDYIFGSLGIIPGTVMYVYLGALVGDIAALGNPDRMTDPVVATLQWTIRLVGLTATTIVTIYLSKLAKKYLNHHL
jgi:uncharacterized membrane protein YdjX (TVP38/TMEM64 family)